MSINAIKKPVNNVQKSQAVRYDTVKVNNEAVKSAALKGLLLKQHIKKQETIEDFTDFDRISTSLLIPEQVEAFKLKEQEKNKKEEFDIKKILKPALVAAGITFATVGGISVILRKYSKVMLEKPDLIQPEDLARNINIVEEPHFAMYRALRDPSAKNILGLVGVGVMSIVTTTGKNFIDGCKEAWTKKQECNINHDLQENLISVEAEAFAGKLNVVNTLLSDTTKYFKSVLGSDDKTKIDYKNHLSFKGNEKISQEDKNKIKTIASIAVGAVGLIGLSYGIFRNYQKVLGNFDNYSKRMQDKFIRADIENALGISEKQGKIKRLIEIFKKTNAKEEQIKDAAKRIEGITEDEISSMVREVRDAILYTNADEAVYGTAGKIQYYCYINEDRGHLYNWLLNPENKFNKYLFLSFASISVLGYTTKAIAEAIKNTAVAKENSKSELNLRKQLISTEINNFKAKKMSAINPLLDNFIIQLEKGKSKEELKELAETILIEIKNGPPYVYG
ncbi:MAG: hypothetical protein IJ003_04215 [Candidatus Gastranaerophilales bacterium]|nr:hypothetical protein [Candidatus Gastranaerophilales bacterium]